jgi:hypothetical protein
MNVMVDKENERVITPIVQLIKFQYKPRERWLSFNGLLTYIA